MNSQLSTTEPEKQKEKLSKQLEQEQNHRNGDHMQGYQWGGGEENGRKGTGNKKYNQQVQNRQGDVKNRGNGEAKELICATHGHELRKDCWREWGYQAERDKWKKVRQL